MGDASPMSFVFGSPAGRSIFLTDGALRAFTDLQAGAGRGGAF